MFKSSKAVFEDALEQACLDDIKDVIDIINLWGKMFGLMLQFAKVKHCKEIDTIIISYLDYLNRLSEIGEIKIIDGDIMALDWDVQLK